MIPLKLTGSLLVLGVGLWAALLKAHREKRRLTLLDAWIDLIAEIRNQIDCYLTPLHEILARADLSAFSLSAQNTKSLSSLLSATREELGEEEVRLLSSFVRRIGNFYREDQVKQCNYYIDHLRELRKKRAAELMPRVRVTLAICLCSSLCVAILLW